MPFITLFFYFRKHNKTSLIASCNIVSVSSYFFRSSLQQYWIAPLSLLLGSALDLNFSDINVASLDRELEDQDNNGLGLTSKTLFLVLVLACTWYMMQLIFKHFFFHHRSEVIRRLCSCQYSRLSGSVFLSAFLVVSICLPAQLAVSIPVPVAPHWNGLSAEPVTGTTC